MILFSQKTKLQTAVLILGPWSLGTLCRSESQIVELPISACHTQEILHILCPHFKRLGTNLSMYSLLQSSIMSIYQFLQFLGVQPDYPWVKHFKLRASWMTNWSQLAQMNKIGYFKVGYENCTKMHFHTQQSARRLEHSMFGGFQFALESCMRICTGFGSAVFVEGQLGSSQRSLLQALTNISLRYLPFYSTESSRFTRGSQNTPESATPQTILGLGTKDLMQSTQRQVAIPPAEDPLTTIFSAFPKPYLLSAHLK